MANTFKIWLPSKASEYNRGSPFGQQVIAGGDITDSFSISNGVRQGCVLAPFLFNIFMTAFLLCLDRVLQDRGIDIRYRFDNGLHNLARLKVQKNVRKRSFAELQYADDLVILANTAEEAQRMMEHFQVYIALLEWR